MTRLAAGGPDRWCWCGPPGEAEKAWSLLVSRHPTEKGDRVSGSHGLGVAHTHSQAVSPGRGRLQGTRACVPQVPEQRSGQSSAVAISAVTITVMVIAGDVSDSVVGSASFNTLPVSSRVEDLLSERLPFQHDFYFHQKEHFPLPLAW